MTFKTTLLVCGLVLSVQHAYSQILGQGFGLGSGFGAVGVGGVEFTAVDIDATGIGAAYGHGYGIGNAGYGIGNAGYGISNAGYGIGNAGYGLGAAGFGMAGVGLGPAVVAPSPAFINLNTIGGILPISSIGPVVPAGLTVVSDNVIEGIVTVEGQLPFLSAVAFDGVLPSAGTGHTQCGCGTAGNIGIISETVGSAPIGFPAVAGGYNLGLGGGLAGGLVGPAGFLY